MLEMLRGQAQGQKDEYGRRDVWQPVASYQLLNDSLTQLVLLE